MIGYKKQFSSNINTIIINNNNNNSNNNNNNKILRIPELKLIFITVHMSIFKKNNKKKQYGQNNIYLS